MTRGMLLIAALLLFLAGCTTVHTIDFTGQSSAYYRMTTVAGTRVYGRDLEQTPDSTRWIDAAGRRRELASVNVASVERVAEPTGFRHWTESFAEINALARRKQARVTLPDGTSYLANDLQVARDTTTWLDPHTGAMYHVVTANIAEVLFYDGKRGALGGLALGAAVGGVAGLAIGFSSGDDPADEWFALTAGQKAVAAGLVLDGLGSPVGAIVGSGSKRLFRFSMTTLPGVPSQAPTAALPIVSPPPRRDALETERPRMRTTRRAGSRWTASILGAGAVRGAARGLEEAMKISGFGQRSECTWFCSVGGDTRHPHSSGGVGWLIDMHRDIPPYGNVGFLVSHVGGETLGYDGSAHLFISQHVTTVASVFLRRVQPALRFGLGPALHRVGTQRTDAPKDAVHRHTRLGLVADFALTFPNHTRFYLDLRAQYRWIGTVEVGPPHQPCAARRRQACPTR